MSRAVRTAVGAGSLAILLAVVLLAPGDGGQGLETVQILNPNEIVRGEERQLPADPLGVDGHGDELAEQVVLRNEVGADELTWRVVASVTASSETCLDAEVLSSSDEGHLGSIGGCGIPEVEFDSLVGFTSASPEVVLSPVEGWIRIDEHCSPLCVPGSMHTVITGVATCVCTVRVTFADGATFSNEVASGTFLVHRPGEETVHTIEALDAGGAVLASTDLNTLSESPR